MLTGRAAGRWAASHMSIDNLTNGSCAWVLSADSAVTFGVQYRAIYQPVRVPRSVVVRKLGYGSETTGAGNIDIGLYDAGGTRLVSSGSTAKPTTAGIVAVDVTDTTIGPGFYYIALNSDSTSDTFIGFSLSSPHPAAFGVLTETLGSVTLPATATWVVTQTLNTLPVVSALLVTEVA